MGSISLAIALLASVPAAPEIYVLGGRGSALCCRADGPPTPVGRALGVGFRLSPAERASLRPFAEVSTLRGEPQNVLGQSGALYEAYLPPVSLGLGLWAGVMWVEARDYPSWGGTAHARAAYYPHLGARASARVEIFHLVTLSLNGDLGLGGSVLYYQRFAFTVGIIAPGMW